MAISFIAGRTGSSATGTSFGNVSPPVNYAVGDVLITQLACSQGGSSIGSFTWSSGWNVFQQVESVNSTNSVVQRVEWAWHTVAATGELYTFTVPTLFAGARVYQMFAYRGVDTTTPIVDSGIVDDPTLISTSATQTSNTVTSSVSGLWQVAGFSALQIGGSPTWTEDVGLERAETSPASGTYRTGSVYNDSNGIVDASGGLSVTATVTGSTYVRIGMSCLLQPTVVASSSKMSCGILLG